MGQHLMFNLLNPSSFDFRYQVTDLNINKVLSQMSKQLQDSNSLVANR